MVNSRTLKLAGMHWLAYEKQCRAVACERSIRFGLGDPDIFGVTKHRFILELEIKVSLTDFKRNAEKRHVITRDLHLKRWPRQFWFLVPPTLVDKVRPLLPAFAGLLTVDHLNVIQELVAAPINTKSERASIKECSTLVRVLTNHVIAAERQSLQNYNGWKSSPEYQQPEYEI